MGPAFSQADEQLAAEHRTKAPRQLRSSSAVAAFTLLPMPEPSTTHGLLDSSAEPPPPPAADRSEWLCLECDYSLAHTKQDRCPECGTAFSPERYAVIYSDRTIPSFPWDDGRSLANWWRTARIVLLRPREFRERISASPNGWAAFDFACFTYAAMFVVVNGAVAITVALNECFATGIGMAPNQRIFMLSAPWPMILSAGECALATVAGNVVQARERRNSVATWAVVLHYHSVFALLLGTLIAATLVAAQALGLWLFDHPGYAAAVQAVAGWPILIIATLVVLLWQFRVERAFALLSRPHRHRYPGLLLLGLLVTGLMVVHISWRRVAAIRGTDAASARTRRLTGIAAIRLKFSQKPLACSASVCIVMM